MKAFKFGQLLAKRDICDRQEEIGRLGKICRPEGRVVVYGPRRFGKTSVVKNVILEDFIHANPRALGVYADLFRVDSMEEAAQRLQVALGETLSKQAKVKTFLKTAIGYLKNLKIEISADPVTGLPTVTIAGSHAAGEATLSDIFISIKNLSKKYELMLVLDEFQDIANIKNLEAVLRSQIQDLKNTSVILMGSKKHILREIFYDETRPFYGFGTDIEFKKIPRKDWLPYMRERFGNLKITIEKEEADEICNLMNDVPNAIQELCHWIAVNGPTGPLTAPKIQKQLLDLIENKQSRYFERLASLSHKEKKVLFAVAREQPVASITGTKFLLATQVSSTATKATIHRLTDQGVLDLHDEGTVITDPLFRTFLLKQYGQLKA